MKPLLVGEANPYGADPYFALYPRPEKASGYRLCSLVLGMREAAYLDLFDRVNLCPQSWSMGVARAEAVRLRSVPAFQAVLLGRKVAEAFGLGDVPAFTTWRPGAGSRGWCVLLPHPSGLCLEWNKPGAFERARALVQEVYPYDLLR